MLYDFVITLKDIYTARLLGQLDLLFAYDFGAL